MNLKNIISAVVIVFLSLSVDAKTRDTLRTIPIRTFADLLKLSRNYGKNDSYPADGVYLLSGAIDASVTCGSDPDSVFKPIGTMDKPFIGTFKSADNRKTFVIRNLCIDMPDSGHVGLFGVIGEKGTVQNVGLDAAKITGFYAVGTLAGANYGTVNRTFGKGEVRASREHREYREESNAGGLVGVNGGLITVSYSEAKVYGEENVGGLVGLLTKIPVGVGRLFQTYSAGSVEGTHRVGGLVGRIFSGDVEESHSASAVSLKDNKSGLIGGLVGDDFVVTSTSYRVRGASAPSNYIVEAPLERCYWDMDKSKINTSAFGGGKVIGNSAKEMVDSLKFKEWDFDDIWIIPPKAYPHFERPSGINPDYAPFRLIYGAGDMECGHLRITVDGVDAEVFDREIEVIPGTDYKVTAVREHGCRFVEWSDGVKDSSRTDTVSVNVSAIFDRFRLIYGAGDMECGHLRITVDGVDAEVFDREIEVIPGTDYKVTAVPWEWEYGCRFVGWSDGVTDSSRRDTSDVNASVIFVRDDDNRPRHLLRYLAENDGRIQMGGIYHSFDYLSEMVPHGARGPIVAVKPDSGMRFAGWMEPGVTGRDMNIVRVDIATGTIMRRAVFEADLRTSITISSYDDLKKIGNETAFPIGGIYELDKDIDASDSDFTPIGTPDRPFSGVFRGHGHKIHNLRVNRPNDDFAGLFGYADNAVISGVYLVNAEIIGKNDVGAFVGKAINTVVDNCVSVVSSGSSGFVRGAGAVGGLVGSGSITLVRGSYSTLPVTGSGRGTGGLVGIISGSMISGSYAFGGAVKGGEATGGLIGAADGGMAQFSYAQSSVNGGGALGVGGLIGIISGGMRILHCYSAGSVEGLALGSGGLVGRFGSGGGRAFNSYWDMEKSGQTLSSGGMARSTASMMLKSTYNEWDFDNANPEDRVWGIADSYPYLLELPPGAEFGGLPKSRFTAVKSSVKPTARIVGRNLHIDAPSGSSLQIRLVDMRGRQIVRYDIKGGARIPLTAVPAGRYIVDIRENGKRTGASPVRVVK